MPILVRQPNSRQIPRDTEYTANPLYNDLMYGYLQSISLPGKDGVRYVKASEVSQVKLSAAIDIKSTKTVKKYFEGMQELYLIGKKQNGKYELLHMANEYAMLVPQNVLKLIVDQSKPRLLSVYVYFLMMSGHQNQVEWHLNHIKDFLGLSTNTYSNSHLITEALDDLESLGLLNHRESRTNENGEWKVKKYVSNVTNILENVSSE